MVGSKSVGTVDTSVTKGSRGTHFGGINGGVIPIRFRGGKEGRVGMPKNKKKAVSCYIPHTDLDRFFVSLTSSPSLIPYYPWRELSKFVSKPDASISESKNQNKLVCF